MKRAWLIYLGLASATLHAAELPKLPGIPPGQPFAFAVLGDNRGDDSGEQPPAFLQVLQAVEHQAPAFVLDTGDMIYGHSSDEARVRAQWSVYSSATDRLRAPIFHVPGNHDIWDKPSAHIYQELWGKTYYAFDYGNARFIGLDTETANGQLADEEIHWLEQMLQSFAQQNVFVFLHRPLFPVDGGIGSSLDAYPAVRDRIHKLFAQHRRAIRGVFAGHEHLYHFQERDGVPYYITGGAGAPLYTAPELGGFHHFLWVRVDGTRVDVELKKVCAAGRELQKPRPIAAGETLESWQKGLFWYAWDRTATIELTPEHASDGHRGMRLNFDLEQYAWPVLVLAPASPLNLEKIDSLILDVYVPSDLPAPLSVTTTVQGASKHEAPSVRLTPGWNTVATQLDGPWLPPTERRSVHSLEWSVSSERTRSRGYVVFDNFRTERRTSTQTKVSESLESWERPLLWRVFDETVRAETAPASETDEERGLVLHLDLAKCNRPVVFAQLNPPWDLTQVKALILDLSAPGNRLPDDLMIGLAFRANDVEFAAAPAALRSRTRQIRFELEGSWLPQTVRAAVEQVAFKLSSTNNTSPIDLRFKKLTASSHL